MNISRSVTALFSICFLVALGCSSDSSTLTVYSGRSESLVGAIIEQFHEATGIEVAVKYGSTSEITATLLEEGENTPADVFFAQDPGALGEVVDMLVPVPEDILDLVPGWARSPDDKWVGISGRARVVVYNTNTVRPSDMPGSLKGFTDPKWKGRIGWPPSNGSFQAMVTAIRVMWGDGETREWLQGIQTNQPKVYPKNTPVVAAAASGEIDVGFVNHYYLYRFLQESGEGFGARNHHLAEGGPGSIILVSGAGILDTAKNVDDAQKFLRFMLSTVAQQYFASQTFEYPLVVNINTHRSLPPILEVNNPSVDMASLSDLKGTQRMLRDLGIIP